MLIEQQIFDSYLAMIKNSPNSGMFRNYFAKYDGQLKDGLEDGALSCAFFVSSIATLWGVLDRPHATITSTIEALQKAGWQELSAESIPEAGDILLWEEIKYEPTDKVLHSHIGFYIDNERAVSTNFKTKTVTEHDWQFKDTQLRKVVQIYRGKQLMPNRTKEI